MARLWLPLGAAIRNPSTERQAIIMRLRQLGQNVIGAERPDFEISQLRDILASCEREAQEPEIVTPPPRFTKKVTGEALKDYKRFHDERKAGRRKFY